uniref:Cytosolic fatty-acid binding proteins domain-containing protein n=1 Tax=Acrobeloides nanus TaxID=290746 RepID=A0A914D202_9BILA
MQLIYGIFVVIFASTALAVNQIPDQFLGKWSVEKSDNFDEFLTAKGYGWLMRTLIKNSGMTKAFEKSGATFNYKIFTPTKDVIWNGIHFGQPYVGKYLDDSRHQ